MRSIILGASLAVLLFALGCNHLIPHNRPGEGIEAQNATKQPPALPTADNLVEYLNRNAACLKPDQALTTGFVNIIVDAENKGRIGIDCKMICQAPRNLMLSGVLFGNPAVDIGSNNKEFWFWSKEINPPYLYHCSYDDLAQGVQIPFPFQPEMAVTALGLAQYDRTKKYDLQVIRDKKGWPQTIELTEHTVSPEKKPIKKVTVFNGKQSFVPQPQVIKHILKDEKDNIVCVATIRTAQQVGGDGGPIIPQIIDFSWPDQKLKMTMRIDNPRIVAMPPEKAANTFTRQNFKIQSVNLATQALDNGGVERTGASVPFTRR